jgi:hypothetical protein
MGHQDADGRDLYIDRTDDSIGVVKINQFHHNIRPDNTSVASR